MTLQMRVYVPDHPLIKHWLTIARDAYTPSALFKTAMKELGCLLTYEATRYWFPMREIQVQTPLAECPATIINPEVPLAVIPILRAGLALLEGAQSLLLSPLVSIYHLGLVRDETTLEASFYLNKLPEKFQPDTRILLLDPMLATGGTMLEAMAALTSRGADPALMRIVSVVTAPPALKKLSEQYPSLNIYTAIIDEGLNSKGYIVPGLGDAGDRTFGT